MRLGVQGTPPNPPPKSDKASILHSLNKGCFAKYLESTQTWDLSMWQNFLEIFYKECVWAYWLQKNYETF